MFVKIKPLQSAEQLKSTLSVPAAIKTAREQHLRTLRGILSGTDKRRLMIVGPCSADNPAAVCDYACRLAAVAEKVKDVFFTVMRAYTAKPRTRGAGYMGLLHEPDPNSGVTDFDTGLKSMRELHLRIASEAGLPTADEMVYPELAEYVDDIVSYITIGARTSENPTHRFVASGMDVPVGIKNSMNGNARALASSIYAAGKQNRFIFGGTVAESTGNNYVHAILRGAVDISGNNIPNYGRVAVAEYSAAFAEQGLNCGAVIDTGHANSGKDTARVAQTVRSVTQYCKGNADYGAFVKGFMVESYLVGGRAEIGAQSYGQSITDPCLGFDETEKLILAAADALC